MKTTNALGILIVTLALSAQVQAQFAYTNNGDGTCSITGYTGAGGPVVIPENIGGLTVTSVGQSAFYETSVTSVTIPNSVTSIESEAFFDTSLTNATLPNGVTSIGDQAFAACDNLNSITLPNSITNIGSLAFEGCLSLTNLTLPISVRAIGESAFSYAGLINVTIPSSVTSISEGTFEYCSSLISITIPESVTNIEGQMYGDGGSAFADCDSLTSLYFMGNAPAAEGSTFQSDSKATAYYLAGTTGWANFSAETGLPVVMLNGSVQTGSLQVTILPTQLALNISASETLQGGGIWQVDGGTLQQIGAIVTNLSVGLHTVSFSAISGWTTPANQTVTITSGGITTATGTYVALAGTNSTQTNAPQVTNMPSLPRTTLNIALTAKIQLPNKTSGTNLTTMNTQEVSVTSKSILKLLGTIRGAPFPSGSYLALDGGTVEVISPIGYGTGTNLSGVFTIKNGIEVGSGTTNSATGKQNASGMVYTVITFNDGNGNTFTVDGLIKETISLTAENGSGDQTETGSFSGDVAGYGTLVDSQRNKDTAVFSGTISGSGKGPAK